ncbi:hypothetical protein DQ04_08481030 [Trypanosoma grayi]|uniref:hypothetical protein n=1 Tax=Trypanosoma grayi TaxID=71804 RepID=UPI0004F444EC|nr:hypothetical protein DQ04_08481030 [Trypanosoma grayi]KEG07917.1 hypothetical protein DQ04_08481030 [Trypanosoma grayi]
MCVTHLFCDLKFRLLQAQCGGHVTQLALQLRIVLQWPLMAVARDVRQQRARRLVCPLRPLHLAHSGVGDALTAADIAQQLMLPGGAGKALRCLVPREGLWKKAGDLERHAHLHRNPPQRRFLVRRDGNCRRPRQVNARIHGVNDAGKSTCDGKARQHLECVKLVLLRELQGPVTRLQASLHIDAAVARLQEDRTHQLRTLMITGFRNPPQRAL